MSSLNCATLLGRVGKDPEIRSMQNGREVATFSLATSNKWTDKQTGEQKEITDWHKIVVFSEGLVKVIKNYVKKGSQIYIKGEIKTRKWTDDKGVDRYTTEIVLQGYNTKLLLLDSGKFQNGTNQENTVDDNSDIPF